MPIRKDRKSLKFQIRMTKEGGKTLLVFVNTGSRNSMTRHIEVEDQTGNGIMADAVVKPGNGSPLDISHLRGRCVIKVNGVVTEEVFVAPNEIDTPFTISEVLHGLNLTSSILIINNGPTLDDNDAKVKIERADGSTVCLSFPTLETNVPYLLEFSLAVPGKLAIWIGDKLVAYRNAIAPLFGFFEYYDKKHQYWVVIKLLGEPMGDEAIPLTFEVFPGGTSPTHSLLLQETGEKQEFWEPYAAPGKVVTIKMNNVLVAGFMVQGRTDVAY